jgi:hypothetical protein
VVIWVEKCTNYFYVFTECGVQILLGKFFIVFLDDILIYAKTEEEHEKHLRMMLQVLREHQLYAKLSKCTFYKKKSITWATFSQRRA